MRTGEIGGLRKGERPLSSKIKEGRDRIMIEGVHPSFAQFCYKPEQGDRILNLADECAIHWSVWEEGLIHQNSVH